MTNSTMCAKRYPYKPTTLNSLNGEAIVPLTIGGKRYEYRVVLSGLTRLVNRDDGLSWDKAIKTMRITDNLGSTVYKGVNHGNRIAILVNLLHQLGQTSYVEHNGAWYIYIKSMDVLISRATKKITWQNKNNPQRKKIVEEALKVK